MSDDRQNLPEPVPEIVGPSSAIKHSAAIQIENSISLLQRRTWNVLLANAYDELAEREVHTIKVQHLMNVLGFESKNERYLKEALKALAGCTVEWNLLGKDGTERWGVTALLAQAEIESGICTYAYSPVLRRRLHNPNMYAKISLSIQKRFNSKHALALYELCLDYLFEARNYGETPFIPITTFRRLMGLDDGIYPTFKRLNQRVIKEPVEEINDVTDLNVRVEYRRKGRKVVAVKFRIWCTVELAEKPELQGELFPDRSQLPPLVADLIEAGLPKQEAMTVYEQGFDYVNPDKRSHRTDFVRYISEKIDLLHRRQREGKIKNPVGFLLEAIREDYTNFEFEARERARMRQVISQDLTTLLKEKETIEQVYQEAVERACARFLKDDAERAQSILDAVVQSNPFYRSYVDRKKTALENYEDRPLLAGVINHQLRTDYPETFDKIEREFKGKLSEVGEKIAVLEAERDSSISKF
ncbi:MAG: replication initiation protein [Candidatus Poribacteria bacterium]|nr:replication initiation protein [Candidatus Poribacteria bacterium]